MHTDGVGGGGKMEPNKEEDEADEGSLGPKS